MSTSNRIHSPKLDSGVVLSAAALQRGVGSCKHRNSGIGKTEDQPRSGGIRKPGEEAPGVYKRTPRMNPLDAHRAEVAYAAVEERPFEGRVTNFNPRGA